jgi:hypothetical protein
MMTMGFRHHHMKNPARSDSGGRKENQKVRRDEMIHEVNIIQWETRRNSLSRRRNQRLQPVAKVPDSSPASSSAIRIARTKRMVALT